MTVSDNVRHLGGIGEELVEEYFAGSWQGRDALEVWWRYSGSSCRVYVEVTAGEVVAVAETSYWEPVEVE